MGFSGEVFTFEELSFPYEKAATVAQVLPRILSREYGDYLAREERKIEKYSRLIHYLAVFAATAGEVIHSGKNH